MLVTHIQTASRVHSRHQRSEANTAAGIRRPDDVGLLVIMKDGFGADFARFGIADAGEAAVVVIDGHWLKSGDLGFGLFPLVNQFQVKQPVVSFSDLAINLRQQVGEQIIFLDFGVFYALF